MAACGAKSIVDLILRISAPRQQQWGDFGGGSEPEQAEQAFGGTGSAVAAANNKFRFKAGPL